MQAATIIDRAWIQSWLTSVVRQDRAAYQLTTHRKELDVALPAGAPASQAVVLVDGQRVECQAMAEDRLVVPLAAQRDHHRFVIELQYYFTDGRPLRGALRLEFPRLGPNLWVRRHVLAAHLTGQRARDGQPGLFHRRVHLGLGRLFLGPAAAARSGAVGSWVGATPRPTLPERDNLYLFSTLGDVPAAEIQTASRTWIVLWASGAALVIGLMLIYLPAARHPAVLWRRAWRLLAAGLIAPEPAFLLAQAASLGLGLTLLTGLFARGMSGRRRRVPPRKETSHSRVEVGSTRSPRPPRSNGPASTESIPAVQPPPPGNAER